MDRCPEHFLRLAFVGVVWSASLSLQQQSVGWNFHPIGQVVRMAGLAAKLSFPGDFDQPVIGVCSARSPATDILRAEVQPGHYWSYVAGLFAAATELHGQLPFFTRRSVIMGVSQLSGNQRGIRARGRRHCGF